MVQKTPWHLFFKCFQNQATSEELAEINHWLREDVENLELLEEIYHIYSVSKVSPPLNTDTTKAWHQINQKISSDTVKVKPLYNKFRYVVVVAALLVFGLFILSIVNKYRWDYQSSHLITQIITKPGQKTSVVLPDGSTVWLNSASSLKYSSDFNKKDREVILAGEAFFDVQKDISKRFRVKSGSLYVDVHGTSFDIKNYSDDNLQKVTVAGGIVGITTKSKEIRRLTIGQQAVLNKKSGKITFTKEDPDLVSAWKNNELIFRDTPIEEVIKSLESWYGVNITVDNRMIAGHNYTFRIKTESFKEVLDMMKVMTPFEYKINGKDIDIKYKN